MTCLAPSSQGSGRPAGGGQEAPAPWGAGRALPVLATLPRTKKYCFAQRANRGEILKISLTDFFNTLKSFNFYGGNTVLPPLSGHPA